MQELFNQLLYNVMMLLVTVAAGFLVAWLKKRLGVEGVNKVNAELQAKQELAAIAVRFVEQVYQELRGEEKFLKAAEWLSTEAAELGIKVSTKEVKGLIEASLRAFKDEFGEGWANIPKSS